MNARIFCTALLALILLHGQAQNIKRKGSLGVNYYQTTPDSLAKSLQYRQGTIVKSVLPGTTAAAIGLQANDIIINLNGIAVTHPSQLPVLAKTLREDSPIQLTVIRNKQETVLKGIVVGRPKETSSNAAITYGEFAYGNGFVRTIYKAPKSKQPLGTIYFLQGLPCYSMDNFTALDKTKQALDAMVDRGFAVYRMEKADMGDNTNQLPCESMGFDDELKMYKAGYENLLRLSYVDTTKIFLFGHSMGGVTAPLLAEKFQPKGVVVYGTVFKPWLEYLMDAYTLQLQHFGMDLAILRDSLEAAKPFIYDYFYGNKTIEEVCQTKEGLAAMELIMSYDAKSKTGVSGRSASIHKEMNQHNLAKAWGNTSSHVLAIYGECDIAAIHPDDHQALIAYINKKHPGKGSFWQAPKTSHTFEEVGSMEEFVRWQSDPVGFAKFAAEKFNPKVFDYACNWMKEVIAK